MRKKIVFLDVVHSVLEEGLIEKGFVCEHFYTEKTEELTHLLRDFEGIVVRSRVPLNEELLSNIPHIKFIARSGAGMENIDVSYCERRGITLFNAPEGNRNAVAEHALGMLLSLFNRIHLADREVRNGVWNREENRGVELDEKTVGIIGYGNNGSAFAHKLKGFDVDVLVYDKYKSGFSEGRIVETDLDTLLNKADVISFHIPQNEETLFMADDAFFSKLSKSVYLINLSRGKIVKTSSLRKALESGKVLGACLDVLEYEKSSFEKIFDDVDLPDDFNFLIKSDKVILTPHVGGWTQESYYKLSAVLLDKIVSFYENQ